MKVRIILLFLILAFVLMPRGASAQSTEEKSLLEKVAKAYTSRDWGGALQTLDETILKYPRNYSAYFLRGDVKIILHQFDSSLEDSTTALRLAGRAKGIEKIYSNIGVVYQVRGDNALALRNFEKAIEIEPNYAPPHNGRAVILDATGKSDEALKEFDLFIKLEPNPTAGYVGRSDIRFRRHDLDGALEDANRVVNADQQFPASWMRRGIIFGCIGQWYASVDDIAKAFKMKEQPDLKFTRLDISIADLDSYIKLYPKEANAVATRGLIALLQKDDKRAQIELDRSYEMDTRLKDQIAFIVDYIKKTR